MGRIVGIDLGTTYSAIGIPEERSGEGFATFRKCPGCSIILDNLKRRITPSVATEDDRGQIIIGYPAKARAGLLPEPIMFSKRRMGEDVTFPLAKHAPMLPEEVAAEVLRYLKSLAEKRLGETVDEAVITVPAYFSLRAKQMTKKAGELAGLNVLMILHEPVAAAMMYCINDPRDPLRIMTYDLGGGTFDVAILEKRGRMIDETSLKAFDGDCFLGGYNFDKSLAWWLVDQLCAKGYDLRFSRDLDSPAEKTAFAKLLVYAERAKIELSQSEEHFIVDHNTGINDRSGNPVIIEQTISRAEFEDMIRESVDYTLEVCHRAMEEKADPPITPEEIDEIVMVGGSSRIPLVSRRLSEEFGKEPKLIEPDLCIAMGASLVAGTLPPPPVGNLRLDVIPSHSVLTSLTITGRLVPGEGLPDVKGSEVRLQAGDGSYDRRRVVQSSGGFAFESVPLVPNGTQDILI